MKLVKCKISGIVPDLEMRLEPAYSFISGHYMGDEEKYDLRCIKCNRYGKGCSSGCYDFRSRAAIIEAWNEKNGDRSIT